MRNFMTLHSASRFTAFAGRSIAAMTRKWRSRRVDDALARLDDFMLQDVGLDRCEIRYVARPGYATPIAGELTSAEPPRGPLQFQYVTRPMLAAEDYQMRAEACLRHAEWTNNIEARQSLVSLAQTYRCLADRTDRREDAVVGD